MVDIVKLRSESIVEERLSFSRAVVVGDWIFLSNTAGRNYSTRFMSDDAVEQATQCLHNIEGALRAVGAELADIVRSRVSIPHQEDVEPVMAYVSSRLRGIDPASTITRTPLAGAYRVEIEVTAYRGAGQSEQERRSVVLG